MRRAAVVLAALAFAGCNHPDPFNEANFRPDPERAARLGNAAAIWGATNPPPVAVPAFRAPVTCYRAGVTTTCY